MKHLATITIGAGMVLAVASGTAGSTEAAPASTVPTGAAVISSAVVPASYSMFSAPASSVMARRKCPRGTYPYKVKTGKGHGSVTRCVRAGSGLYGYGAGYGAGYGTGAYPGYVPLPSPPIVTFGQGAGSGITTFGHGLGTNPNVGTGPFGHLGGTTVRQ